MIDVVPRPKKRLFLALIMISLLVTCVSVYGIWMVSFDGLANISGHLPVIFGCLLLLTGIAIASGIAGIVLAILGLPTLGVFQGLAWSAINLLFPLAIRIGKLLDLDKERIERSFIEVSNHLIWRKRIKVRPEKLLVLTPHCIQQESCPHKITRTADNCRQCGGCQVGDLLALSRRLGFHFAVVTGGTLARRVVKTIRPQAVLAIACERDLTSGIQDIYPLPVIGVLNERPFGPCCSTRVDMSKVETAIKQFLDEENVGE
ncbi:DUF116 domain-containing protein|uniref:DUF116 domain-containing protein n=1 Tax=Dendrosporobacter quercicolus TaxID=146817 RepID=A0A1G9M3S6_9FIRM|nr:DUF116 domain-containing protein [Dendrosporobacter quercicolus]NSL46906.1 DUF116 domain-containing protein [Dendrosporobacter quercicolus DSM 1736]SDL68930.1 hypothetical protein SAMN04488502_101557 [Dendrosporobacter quercicolus]